MTIQIQYMNYFVSGRIVLAFFVFLPVMSSFTIFVCTLISSNYRYSDLTRY